MNLQQNTFELADINETLIDEITFFNSVPVPYVELKLFNCVGRYPSVLAERDGGGNQTYSKVFLISEAFPSIVLYHFPWVEGLLRLALSQLKPCNITPDFGFAVLPEDEKGNLYYIQRYAIKKDGQLEGALKGLSIIFKRQLSYEEKHINVN